MSNKRKSKKYLSFILALVMMVTMAPMSIMASGTEEFNLVETSTAAALTKTDDKEYTFSYNNITTTRSALSVKVYDKNNSEINWITGSLKKDGVAATETTATTGALTLTLSIESSAEPLAGSYTVKVLSGSSTPAEELATSTVAVNGISGTITDSSTGNILSGASIQLQNSSGNVGSPVTAGNDGTYTFTGMENGFYNVEASMETYVTKKAYNTLSQVSGGNLEMNIALDPITISGTITDSVTNAGIAAELQLIDSNNNNVGTVVTATADGTYTTAKVPAGTYSIDVSMTGYKSGTIEGIVVTTTAAVTDQDLELDPITISGTITDDANPSNPISGAEIQLKDASGNVGDPVTSGTDGTYTTTAVPAGTYSIYVTKTDYEPGTLEGIVVDDAPVTGKDLTLTKITGDTEVTVVSIVPDGNETKTTNQITITFDKPVTGLTVDDITLTDTDSTGVKMGTLNVFGTDNKTYVLTVGSIATTGKINIKVENITGYTFTDAAKDVTIFKGSVPSWSTLSVTAGTGGRIVSVVTEEENYYDNDDGIRFYKEDAVITVTARPNSGYSFNQWGGTSAIVFNSRYALTTTFKMPARDAEVFANFKSNSPAPSPSDDDDDDDDDNDSKKTTDSDKDKEVIVSADKEIEKQLNKKTDEVVINLGRNESLSLSNAVIEGLIKSNKPLIVKKGNVSVTITPDALVASGMEDSKKIVVSIDTVNTKSNMLGSNNSKASFVSNTVYDVTVKADGKNVSTFTQPLKLSFDLKGQSIKDKSKVTGIRILGNGKYNQLGGTWNGNTLTFQTSKLSQYGVISSENLVSINTQINNNSFTVNGNTQMIDVAPVIVDGYTMVPVRFIAEALGATVGWDKYTETVTINLDGQQLSMRIGQRASGMDVAPYILDDRTMVPLRYVSEQLECNVVWDNATRTVSIYR